jgi:hypothetical protein
MAIALVAIPALAGPHFIGGVGFGLGSLVAQGNFAGYGSDNLVVTLTGSGTVKAMCENPGGNRAPGRNPILVAVNQTGTFLTGQNGKVAITVTSPDPTAAGFEPSPTPKQAGCPNGNWRVVDIIDRSTNWTAARITIKSAAGELYFDQRYSCVTTFDANGINTAVSCTPIS